VNFDPDLRVIFKLSEFYYIINDILVKLTTNLRAAKYVFRDLFHNMAHHSPGNFFTKGSSVSDVMAIKEWVIDLVFTLHLPYY